MTTFEDALHRARAEAWEQGFSAGEHYGRQDERCDPIWTADYDRPSRPENPFRWASKESGK